MILLAILWIRIMSHFVIPRGGGEPFPLLLDTGFCTRYDEKGLNYFFNPDFPLENNYVQVLHHGGPDALAHKPQNQARFFLGTDNSK